MDEEMVWQLQEEENMVERMWWGQDTTTLVVVREAAGPLMWGQVEGLAVLDFVTPWNILAYNFQTVHILIHTCYIIWKVQEKSIKLRYISSWMGVSTES